MMSFWRAFIVAVVVSVCFPSAAFSSQDRWRVVKWEDPITDEKKERACIEAKSGERFCVFLKGGAVFGLLDIRDAGIGTDVFQHGDLPILRVDEMEPKNFDKFYDLMRDLDEPFPVQMESQYVQWRMQIKPNPDNKKGMWYQLISGHELLVRYFIHGGYKKDVRFTLNGSANALQQLK